MSREIKFRVWSKHSGQYERMMSLNCVDGMPTSVCITQDGKRGFTHLRAPNFVLEQYTGLKDKNGKEIYEGDKIKIEGSDATYTVKYGRGVWVARFGDEPRYNIYLYQYVQKDTVLYTEVIGNIHEKQKGDKK